MSSHKSRLDTFLERAIATGQVVLIGPLASELPPSLLLQQTAVLGVDGGCHKGESRLYHYFVGDGDSGVGASDFEFDQKYSSSKDGSDLKLALELVPKEVKKIHLWGFWGGRMDHHLFNLGEINIFLSSHQGHVLWYGDKDHKLEGYAAGVQELTVEGKFSILSVNKAILTITGDCLFPMTTPTECLPLSSLTLSNHGTGRVKVKSDQPFFFYVPLEEN